MNERILELADKAGADIWDDQASAGSHFNIEKFAELIVKDILVIVENYCETTPEIWGLPVEIVDHFDMEIEQ